MKGKRDTTTCPRCQSRGLTVWIDRRDLICIFCGFVCCECHTVMRCPGVKYDYRETRRELLAA